MPDVMDALYAALQASPTFVGKTVRDRPSGAAQLPYVVIRSAVEQNRRLDLDGQLRSSTWRLDVVSDDGASSETIESLAEDCAALFDQDPGLTIDDYIVCACSSQGPTDLPPDAETYGRSVLVTLWLDSED